MENKLSRENIISKSDDEIINILARYWRMDSEELSKPFRVIATFRKATKKDAKGNDYGYFEDVRNLNGDILYYPYGFGKVKVFSMHRNSYLKNEYWHVNVRLASRTRRDKYKNPFMVEMDNEILDKPELQFTDQLSKERLIRKIFEETGSTPRDAKNISNALHAIMGDLYTETERFIFELLQNADDQPQNNSLVNVVLKTLNENFLFLHSGKCFSEADVESISSIGDSTKVADAEKTGYKGIGFKSVFSDAETVYINSGNFSFAFDKNSPVYKDETNMDVIPWQIKPIWEERYRLPKEIQNEPRYFSYSVGIALNVGANNIVKYDHIIPELLSEPRFVLFLRNVGQIRFENSNRDYIEIQKKIEGDRVQITSNGVTGEWVIKDYIIDIPRETQDSLQNEKLVPKKLKESSKTKITFAAKISNGLIEPVEDAVLFTYLPTKVNDFGYKFLVNADFLTTASRESIHFKNIWNRFLFENIGRLLVDWVQTLSEYNGALSLLPNKFYDGENMLGIDFSEAFKNAILEAHFIKAYNGQLLSQRQIMIDKSGLSRIIGKELFCQIVDPTRSLPHYDNDNEAIINSDIYEGTTKVDALPVLAKLCNNQLFIAWFLKSTEEEKSLLYDWFCKVDTEKRRDEIIKVVECLPIYRFDDGYLSKEEATSTLNRIVIRNGYTKLYPIFKSLGIECSENIDSLPIACFYSDNIVKPTIEYIFNHLKENDRFSRWLSNASGEDIKILTDWLEEQDRSEQTQKILVDFIESLPIVQFSDGYCRVSDIIRKTKKPVILNNRATYKEAIELDANRLIVTNKLTSGVDVLAKIGFDCSKNIELSPFCKYINLAKEVDVYNLISGKIYDNGSLLSPSEKLILFKVLKELDGVGEVKLAQNYIFGNQTGTHRRWLSNMVAYSQDLPSWLYEYTIREDENFPELIPYLVSKEDVFDKIIKDKIHELIKVVSLKDMYLAYKETWTLQFTKKIIDDSEITIPILDMVELQDVESKKYLLKKVSELPLDTTRIYSTADFAYRIIVLALEIYTDEEIRTFTDKIHVEGHSLASYTVSNEVSFDYHEGKTLRLNLSQLLPIYLEAGMINKIKNCLSAFPNEQLDRLLSVQAMSTQEVWEKVDASNGYTPATYLLAIYRTRKARNYYNSYVPNVDLNGVSQEWINSLLNIMFDQKVELYNDSFGYRLSEYFVGYFANEYINPDERILATIELWADSEDKKSYLRSLGVKSERSQLVKFRKSLINNEKLSVSDIEGQEGNLKSTIEYLNNKKLLPLTGKNQISALLEFEKYDCPLSKRINISELKSKSTEYGLNEYKVWSDEDNIRIFIYPNHMPMQLVKTGEDNLLLCSFDGGDYFYDEKSLILYICGELEARDILYKLVSNGEVPFDSSDWQRLFYNSLVSRNEVEKKEHEIEELKRELQKYYDKYGKLSENENVKSESIEDVNEASLEASGMNSNLSKETPKSKGHIAEVKKHGTHVEKDEIDESSRVDINREARYAAREYLECQSDVDCSNWDPEDSGHIIKGRITRNGQDITVVITSSKNRKLYLHPWAFAELMEQPQNLLLNYGPDKSIHSLSFDDIFTDNPNVNLIFDTDIVNPSKIAELANKFMGSKRTCFVVENPNYSQSDMIKSFGLNEKKVGYVESNFNDDDIFSQE